MERIVIPAVKRVSNPRLIPKRPHTNKETVVRRHINCKSRTIKGRNQKQSLKKNGTNESKSEKLLEIRNCYV